MTGHDSRKPGIDIAAKRKKIDAVYLPLSTIDKRERVVRVSGGISMPRVMLGNSQDATSFETTGVCDSTSRYSFRIIAEGTDANDGITGIRVDIDRGRKVDMDAHFTTLTGYFSTIVFDQSGILHGTQHHVLRKTRGAT